MDKRSVPGVQADIPLVPSAPDPGDGALSPRLQRLDTNAEGAFGPQLWQAFRGSIAHLYTVSLPQPSDEARFTLTTRTYATPRGILMRAQGTGFVMKRSPAPDVSGADQLLVVLQITGSVETDYGGRRARYEAGDVKITDYARPFHSVATDYANLMLVIPRESVPAALLAAEPHGLRFPRGSGAARLIGAALQEFYAQADHLTVSEAEAAIEGIVALTTNCARARLTGEESDRLKSRRKAALDYIDAHLANVQLGPEDIADAVSLSRASLYRLLETEGGIRAVLLKRRLDEALRLMLEDNMDEYSLKNIVKSCGFGGTSQFSRAFRARFGMPPRQYLELVRQQDLGWYEARLIADGFDRDSFMWRQQADSTREEPAPDALTVD